MIRISVHKISDTTYHTLANRHSQMHFFKGTSISLNPRASGNDSRNTAFTLAGIQFSHGSDYTCRWRRPCDCAKMSFLVNCKARYAALMVADLVALERVTLRRPSTLTGTSPSIVARRTTRRWSP